MAEQTECYMGPCEPTACPGCGGTMTYVVGDVCRVCDDKRGLEGRLARVIDPDEPPGMGARQLAHSVLRLIENRSGKEALLLSIELDDLAAKHPREA